MSSKLLCAQILDISLLGIREYTNLLTNLFFTDVSLLGIGGPSLKEGGVFTDSMVLIRSEWPLKTGLQRTSIGAKARGHKQAKLG